MGCTICTVKVKLIYECVGVAFGICAGGFYSIVFHMISASIVAFISSIFAALGVYMHVASLKKWMITWTESRFKTMFWINLLVFILSTAGMVGCCVYAGVLHQGLTVDDLQDKENYWMTACWCLITAKWSGMNAYYSRGYAAQIKAMLLAQFTPAMEQFPHSEYIEKV